MQALVLWEISRKQQYIFRSNRLKENKGASIIIEEITEKLPQKIDPKYNENCVYNGGGSSLYRFDSSKQAKEFIGKVSEWIIIDFPGIEVFMVVQEYDNEKGRLTEAIEQAYKKLAKKKNRRKDSGMQISFGIERRCQSTGFPAVDYEKEDNEKKYISAEIKRKLEYSNKNSKKFNELIPHEKSISKFSDLVKGSKSYMAVVHIDGNRMGDNFNKLKNYFSYEDDNYKETNEEYLKALKNFSDAIKEAYEDSFKYMCKIIDKNKNLLKDDTNICEDKFPVIPIIIAGDDITYVANGKIGIESARIFIEYLNKKRVNVYRNDYIKLNACAGVAVVRANYPFMKAYELAEDLCKNAKRTLAEDYKNKEQDYSLIDWHLEQGDLAGGINEIREEHYKTRDGKDLCMRPLYINNNEKWYRYDNFKEAFSNITCRKIEKQVVSTNKIKRQVVPRSKLKRLREILKEGEKEVQIYLDSNNIEGYFSRFEDTIGNYCFNDGKCMYFDAIEIMDLFIELDEGKEK